ncbi:MAG: hypothetical protein ACI37Q_06095 [Candidatus Gastranaerophilaceae bacterium]
MKKIIILFACLMVTMLQPQAYAIENITSLDDVEVPVQEEITEPKTLKAEIKFDWLEISQAQRDENIEHFKNLLFENNTSKIKYTKEEFNKEFAAYKKDKDFKLHYMLTNEGVTEDEDAKYCAFYFKKNTLVMYAIQYKNNPTKAFYYTAFGKLYYTDVISDEYPNFPYTSMQYNRKGELKSAIYFVSKDIQYMFDPDMNFQGIWYKDKMYDKNGKQTITRTAW